MSPKKYPWSRVLKVLSSLEALGFLWVRQEAPLTWFPTLCAGSLTTIASDSGLRSTFWRLFPSLFPFSVAGFLSGQREEENIALFRDTLDSSLFSDYLRCHVFSVKSQTSFCSFLWFVFPCEPNFPLLITCFNRTLKTQNSFVIWIFFQLCLGKIDALCLLTFYKAYSWLLLVRWHFLDPAWNILDSQVSVLPVTRETRTETPDPLEKQNLIAYLKLGGDCRHHGVWGKCSSRSSILKALFALARTDWQSFPTHPFL